MICRNEYGYRCRITRAPIAYVAECIHRDSDFYWDSMLDFHLGSEPPLCVHDAAVRLFERDA